MSEHNSNQSRGSVPLQSVRFVGPATEAVLQRDGYDATAIADKSISYRMLVDSGVNPGVAAKIRREHSLSWSFSSGGDLDRRSAQIRGLGSAEAEWIAASAGDWEQTTPVSSSSSTSSASATGATSADPTPWSTHGESTAMSTDTATTTASTTADDSGEITHATVACQIRRKPTPLTELAAVDDDAADLLAEAGITSVRSLATTDPDRIADVLELPSSAVDEWHRAARENHHR